MELKVAWSENFQRIGELDDFRLGFNKDLGATHGELRTHSPSGALYEVSSKFGKVSEFDIFSIFCTETETGRDCGANRPSQSEFVLEEDV